MSGYKTFAVWGAGNLGGKIASSLLARKASVIILTRPASKDSKANQDLAAKGAVIQPYDVEGADAVSGLKDVDVIVATVGHAGLSLQIPLATAAQKAGVKLFVPGEFGDTMDGRTDPAFGSKIAVRKHLEELGLATTVYYTGFWPEFFEVAGLNFMSGKIVINGSGDAELSTTSILDVADFVAYTLTQLPKEKLENADFTLEGDKITFNGITKALEQLSGKKFDVTYVSRATLEERAAAGDGLAGILVGWDKGLGLHPNPLSHDVYPGFKPKTATEVLGPTVQ